MNWNAWFYTQLVNHEPLTARVPASRIHPAGSLEASPHYDRFIVVRWLPTVVPFPGAEVARNEVWVHDRAGTYIWINETLNLLRDWVPTLLPPAGAPMAGQPGWEGFSQEGVDDAFGTITRNAAFRFSGRV